MEKSKIAGKMTQLRDPRTDWSADGQIVNSFNNRCIFQVWLGRRRWHNCFVLVTILFAPTTSTVAPTDSSPGSLPTSTSKSPWSMLGQYSACGNILDDRNCVYECISLSSVCNYLPKNIFKLRPISAPRLIKNLWMNSFDEWMNEWRNEWKWIDLPTDRPT